MTDHIKKEPEDETIIDSAKIYDALRKNYFDRCFLSSYLDEKIDDNLHPFSDEAYNKMKFLHDEKDNLHRFFTKTYKKSIPISSCIS